MKKDLKKCEICSDKVEELYETDQGKNVCGDCFGDEVMADFDEEKYDKLFEEALEKGKVRIVNPETKPVTIRINVFDIQKAKKLAKERNMPYQTLLKEIIHKNLA